MPYLGNVPAEAYSQMSYQDLTGGSGTSFTLDYPVGNENEIEVFVNNVRQEPTVAYTTAGTALTMTGTIAATDDFYVVFQGKAQQTIGIPEKQTNGTYLFGNALTVDADGATVATFDRATSDGTIIDVQKNGSAVGSVGVFNGNAYYAGTGCGLRPRTGDISPTNASGSTNDGGVDLGTSSNRFQNIWLSGGAYIGGTATANKLDDYEEGTWTPVVSGSTTSFSTSTSTGVYTKVGRLVTLSCTVIGITGSDTGYLRITGLPFTKRSSGTNFQGTVRLESFNWPAGYTWAVPEFTTTASSTAFYFRLLGDNLSGLDLDSSYVTSGSARFMATITYEAT